MSGVLEVNQKLYYVDIRGNLYTYIVTDITEEGIVVAWEDDTSVSTTFTHEQAMSLTKRYSTIEDAKKEAAIRNGGPI